MPINKILVYGGTDVNLMPHTMLKKLGKTDVSEDEIAELEDSVQKMTDKFIKKVDEAVEVKSKEILTV